MITLNKEQEKLPYYDGSGIVILPEIDPSKEILIKPNVKAEPVIFPVFPYYNIEQ
jgi:hypothetical protein